MSNVFQVFPFGKHSWALWSEGTRKYHTDQGKIKEATFAVLRNIHIAKIFLHQQLGDDDKNKSLRKWITPNPWSQMHMKDLRFHSKAKTRVRESTQNGIEMEKFYFLSITTHNNKKCDRVKAWRESFPLCIHCHYGVHTHNKINFSAYWWICGR